MLICLILGTVIFVALAIADRVDKAIERITAPTEDEN